MRDAPDAPDAPDGEFRSKTRVKKDMLELQRLGAALVDLPAGHLDGLDLPPELREAVLEARRITSHEGKRRQVQYIGRLMREVDPAPIRSQLDALSGQNEAAAAAHRRLEQWRARLLEDDMAVTEFTSRNPKIDTQALRTLIRNAKKEKAEGKPPRAYRELFRFIKECSS